MAEVAGVVVGATSLTIQLLNGCIKGYKTYMGAAGMPQDCTYMKTRLQIEYSHLLDWREVAGLLDLQEGDDLPETLRGDRLTLIAVLTEMRSAMDDLADINGRYVELRPDEHSASDDVSDKGVVDQFSQISLKYERKKPDRKYIHGANHLVQGVSSMKSIIRQPQRLMWVTFDKDAFTKLVDRLTELNRYLQGLLHGYQAQELKAATQRSYLEIVQVRSSVDELKYLVTAAMLLSERSTPDRGQQIARKRNDQALASLARFKIMNTAGNVAHSEQPPAYASAPASLQLSYDTITYSDSNPDSVLPHQRLRSPGVYRANSTSPERAVWIEWKPYRFTYDRELGRRGPIAANLKRVKELVTLLGSNQKPTEFRAPHCLGFFNDRDDHPTSDESEHDFRFGLVFEMLESPVHGNPAAASATPISLYRLLEGPKPSLSERVKLAHMIANSMLYLHAVSWLHKAFRSDSVIFFSSDAGLDDPVISGFEYSRPDKDGETTTGGDVDEYWEMYMHPTYQGRSGKKRDYMKTFDLYGLGLVLLEIAYWQRLDTILGLSPNGDNSPTVVQGLQQQILDPAAGVLNKVKGEIGERYHNAVKGCILGKEAFGIEETEKEVDIGTSIKLQRNFIAKVVDKLGGISV